MAITTENSGKESDMKIRLVRAPLLVVVAAAVTLSGCMWPSFGHDLANSRHQDLERRISRKNVDELREAWRVDGLAGVTSTPAIWRGTAYVGTWNGMARAINLADGSALTAFQLRRADGSAVWAGGSHRPRNGNTRTFGADEVRFEPLAHWTSAATQARYPVRWRVHTPAGVFELRTRRLAAP